jgi:CHC2 zinc finger
VSRTVPDTFSSRLKAKGKRGDVALGQCMRKLLHLVYAVWKTNQPFDKKHFAGETPSSAAQDAAEPGGNETAVGHKRDVPAEEVVTTATATVAPMLPPVKASLANRPARPKVDFAFLRQQVSMEQVLRHLGLFDQLRGRGLQRRGSCPLHGQPNDRQPTFSAHLGKHLFQCFHADCGAHGNVLDLWAAIHQLPLYEAALNLAETFQLPRNREEEPVSGTR